MVLVKKIDWISKNAMEAEVILSDGVFDIICFSQPFSFKEGDTIKSYIYIFDTQKIYFSNLNEEYVKKNGSLFEYELCGVIKDKLSNIIKIGDFLIELDIPLPNDLYNGDYVVVFCERIDIWC